MSSISKFSVLGLKENRKIAIAIFAYFCIHYFAWTGTFSYIGGKQETVIPLLILLLSIVVIDIILCFIAAPCVKKINSVLNFAKPETSLFLALFVFVSTSIIFMILMDAADRESSRPVPDLVRYILAGWSTLLSLILIPSFLVTLVFAHDPAVAISLIKGIPRVMLRTIIGIPGAIQRMIKGIPGMIKGTPGMILRIPNAAANCIPKSRGAIVTTTVIGLLATGVFFNGGEGGSGSNSTYDRVDTYRAPIKDQRCLNSGREMYRNCTDGAQNVPSQMKTCLYLLQERNKQC